MSVTATVKHPQNDEERKFDIPVCTEALFNDVILPVADAHNLVLIGEWGTFIKIDHGNEVLFFRELEILCAHITQLDNCSTQTKQNILGRLKILSEEVGNMLAARADIVILIG